MTDYSSIPPLECKRLNHTPGWMKPPVRVRLLGAVFGAAALLSSGPSVVAQTPSGPAGGGVTSEMLTEFAPDRLLESQLKEHKTGNIFIGAPGVRFYFHDPEDENSYRDLMLGLIDVGPFRDAMLLAEQADVAAERKTGVEIRGYPAFAEENKRGSTLSVFVGRIHISSRTYGERYELADLRRAVESLPLEEIAALSDLPVAKPDDYLPLRFTSGSLRSFLPENVLGLTKASGYYMKRHPSGTPWGGLTYEGTWQDREVKVRVTIWDLGSRAEETRERLSGLDLKWRAFQETGRKGFIEQNTVTPLVLLYVDRFRVQVDAPGQPGIPGQWLRGAFADIDLDRLQRFAGLVPAPEPHLHPLANQPELIAAEKLAEALPEAFGQFTRVDLRFERKRKIGRYGYETEYTGARYRKSEEDEAMAVSISDQGIVPSDDRTQFNRMDTVTLDGRSFHLSAEWPKAFTIVADRFVISGRFYGGGDEGPDARDFARLLNTMDFGRLEELTRTK
ncbi:MAG: hypothetical protein PF795_13730 [Kiritimatiellae bacterium]|jgi:hypothetical protein|nr:hypothetical protein [Kiritimatiellia bacterium]